MKKFFLIFLAAGLIIFVAVVVLNLPQENPLSSVNILQTANQFQPPSADTELWIPILVYHRIGYAPKNANNVYKSLTIEPEWFEKHLQYLKENNFETVKFSDVAEYFETGKPLPIAVGKKPVMINFDDGYKDFYTNAFPILKKYNMAGTVFVIVKSVGSSAYMNWDQLKEINAAGIEIGSHTMYHPVLTASKKTKWEIEESKKVLESELGGEIAVFAYPSGKWNLYIEQLVKNAGYKTARSFTTGSGILQENLFHIPVVRIYANVGLERWKNQLYK
ncbi:polysaccharide deacetylase family protein [Candidatus Peregrinibacteria bacterium]|nr:polysaccharide deacetylase family protein [Candidatus Peregrinibacteria bacterium]